MLKDRNYIYIFSAFILLTLVYLISEYIITGRHFGVPLDDTWIHFRFAENFAKGYFFQYNIGEPVPGSTSPLWVIILSIPFLISSKIYLPASYILGSFFFLLAIIEIYKLSLKIGLSKNYSLLVTLLTLLCGRLLWSSLSGMEITLFCYLTLLIVRKHLYEIEIEKVNISTGILLGLSIAVRPESYLFAFIYYVVTILLLRKSLKLNLRNIILSLIIFIIIILPYPLFSYFTTGSFLPTTFKGKSGALRFIPSIEYLRETGKLFFKDNVFILLLWITGMLSFIVSIFKKNIEKKYLLINLWIFLLPVISSFIAPNWLHHGRYLIPLIPFINIVVIYIFVTGFGYFNNKAVKSIGLFKTIFVSLLILLTLFSTFTYAKKLSWNTENINDQQVEIANWVNKNIPDEKCLGVNDAGAITFLTGKKIVDIEGLITPEMLSVHEMKDTAAGDIKILRYLKKENVNYLIIYREWYNRLVNDYHEYLEKVHSAYLNNNTICGEAEMIVYKIHWEKNPLKD